MKFTRHARNRMRERAWDEADVERVVAGTLNVDTDKHGNPRYLGTIREERVRVVVALDDPGLVVTIHVRRN